MELLVKAEDTTDCNHGCPPDKRPIELHLELGIINLDKPPGPTSHEVASWVRKLVGASRAGHGGTLEPV